MTIFLMNSIPSYYSSARPAVLTCEIFIYKTFLVKYEKGVSFFLLYPCEADKVLLSVSRRMQFQRALRETMKPMVSIKVTNCIVFNQVEIQYLVVFQKITGVSSKVRFFHLVRGHICMHGWILFFRRWIFPHRSTH